MFRFQFVNRNRHVFVQASSFCGGGEVVQDTRALIVVTSHDQLGETGRKTGFYFEELAVPYWALIDAGIAVDIASIRGGKAPYDPRSYGTEDARPAGVARFLNDPTAMEKIGATLRIDDVSAHAYAVVFLPGGHGAMWDLPVSDALTSVLGAAFDNGAIIGAVCHGPAGLVRAKRSDGKPLVAGLRVNAFTDAEEAAVALGDVVPFLLETRLRELGGLFESGPNFTAKAIRDGQLVTGQNPASSPRVAEELLKALSLRTQLHAGTRG